MKSLFENWRKFLITEKKDVDTEQVSKIILLSKEKKILLLKSNMGSYKGHWDLPGGHLQKGETHIQGLKREVKEETGLVLKDVQKVFKNNRMTYFKGELPSDKITLSKEHSEYAFFTFEETQDTDFKTSEKFKKAIAKAVGEENGDD